MQEVLMMQAPWFLSKETFIEQLKECEHFIEAFGMFSYPPWKEQAQIRFGTLKTAAVMTSEEITIQEPAKWKMRAAGGKEKEVVAMVKSKWMGTVASKKGKEPLAAAMVGTGASVAASKNIAVAVDHPKVVSAADQCQACKIRDTPCYHDTGACMSCHAAKRKCEFLEGELVL